MADYDDLRQAARAKLAMQAGRARALQSYYEGDQGIIALLDTAERQTFRTFLQEAQANWCELVVNAVAERLQVVGFRFGSDSDNEAAWTLWQGNQMDADAELVQTDALVTGSSFVLVQPDEDNPTGVSISAESPLQACVLYEPGNRRKAIAGYKAFADYSYDWAYEGGQPPPSIEVLVTPDQIITWSAPSGQPVIEPNPVGAVSLVEVIPQPRTLWWPRSELAPAMPIQDRINTTIFNRMVATDYGAFRQIWATGIRLAAQVAKDSGTGAVAVVKQPLDIGANRLLANENPDGRFGSFPESTLQGYLSSVEQDVNQLAAITQTPPHYLLGQIANLSADAIKAAETGLVAKCRRRALHIGEAWEQVMRLALQLTGNPASAEVGAEVVWADLETRSEGQRVDALVKMATLGVPREILWQKWGATPQEINEWQDMIAAQPAQVEPTAPAKLPRDPYVGAGPPGQPSPLPSVPLPPAPGAQP